MGRGVHWGCDQSHKPPTLRLIFNAAAWPPRVRLCSSVLDRRRRGENGTCPNCVGIPMTVKCASVSRWAV
jgi:hypothetical protein